MMRRTPMKRTGFKRKADAKGLKQTATKPRRKRKQIEGHHDGRYLAACRGQSCYLNIPGLCRCIPEDPTVVPAHSNQGRHGKAGALKARDIFTVPGCGPCHAWIDQISKEAKETKFRYWDDAYARWRKVRAVLMGKTDDSTTL